MPERFDMFAGQAVAVAMFDYRAVGRAMKAVRHGIDGEQYER